MKKKTMSRLPRCIRYSFNCDYTPPTEKCNPDHLKVHMSDTASTGDTKISVKVSDQKDNVVANTIVIDTANTSVGYTIKYV